MDGQNGFIEIAGNLLSVSWVNWPKRDNKFSVQPNLTGPRTELGNISAVTDLILTKLLK